MRAQPIYLARQPILDRNSELNAFELLFRWTSENVAAADDDLFATSTVIANTFTQIGLEQAVGDHDAYINVDSQFLFTDLVEALPADRVVLELLEHSVIDGRTIERSLALREMGYRLAIDDFAGDFAASESLLAIFDIVKLDFQRISPSRMPGIVAKLRQRRVQLVAEKIETPEQFELAKSLGFDLFQGFHFARPEMLSGRREKPAKLALLRLLTLAMEEADTAAIEQEFKRHPTLSINLIRLTNSAALRRRQSVTSLKHALILLGRRQLKMWLQLLLYTADRHNRSLASPLLQLAAVRGKLMELFVAHKGGGNGSMQDLPFMTGILSLMDVLFEMPFEDIVKELNLPDVVGSALLAREGELGALLSLAEQLEQDDRDAVARSLEAIGGVKAEELVEIQLNAFQWANQLIDQQAEAA